MLDGTQPHDMAINRTGQEHAHVTLDENEPLSGCAGQTRRLARGQSVHSHLLQVMSIAVCYGTAEAEFRAYRPRRTRPS